MKKKLKKWWRIKQLKRKAHKRTYAETVEYYRLTESNKRISCAYGSSRDL
jgi:hypothetical protein